MSRIKQWVCSFLQNLGIGFFVAGLVTLLIPSSVAESGIVWAVSLTVIGSILVSFSLLMVILESLPKGD